MPFTLRFPSAAPCRNKKKSNPFKKKHQMSLPRKHFYPSTISPKIYKIPLPFQSSRL